MSVIKQFFENAGSYLTTMDVADILDVVIVAALIYYLISIASSTNAKNLIKGIVLFLLGLAISGIFQLHMINFLLRKAAELGLIALVVLFQPELRRLLERVGSTLSSSRKVSSPVLETAIAQTVLACTEMSDSRTGALIIFERAYNLDRIMTTGTIVNADVTAELLKNLFFNKAPLHDGAVIIRDGRIAAGGCVLPLTQSTNLSKDLGMRHRAGIGLSEQSDAVVIIVSEETGNISVAIDGTLKRHLNGSSLDKILHNEIVS
jgi:diadenylate cyclase